MKRVNLTYDPYGVFRGSLSPAGIYARQKWLGQAGTDAWQRDYQDRTARLFEGQSRDGSWGGSMMETVRRLFGLHLTVRYRDDAIDKALEWLIRTALLPGPPVADAGLTVQRLDKDGSWGRTQREWHTFLVVHALRNKGVL